MNRGLLVKRAVWVMGIVMVLSCVGMALPATSQILTLGNNNSAANGNIRVIGAGQSNQVRTGLIGTTDDDEELISIDGVGIPVSLIDELIGEDGDIDELPEVTENNLRRWYRWCCRCCCWCLPCRCLKPRMMGVLTSVSEDEVTLINGLVTVDISEAKIYFPPWRRALEVDETEEEVEPTLQVGDRVKIFGTTSEEGDFIAKWVVVVPPLGEGIIAGRLEEYYPDAGVFGAAGQKIIFDDETIIVYRMRRVQAADVDWTRRICVRAHVESLTPEDSGILRAIFIVVKFLPDPVEP